MKKTLNILFLLFVFANTNAQKDSLFSDIYIKPEIGYGFVFEHRDVIAYNVKGHIPSLKISVGKSTFGDKDWQQRFRFPDLGFGYYYADLQNPNVLGTVNAGYFFIDIPYIRRENFTFNYNFEMGISRLSKKFNIVDNYENTAIGSHFNAYINLGFNTKFKLSDKFILTNTLNFTHYSNAKSNTPNLGLNVINITSGVQYYLRPQFKSRTKTPNKERDFKNIYTTNYSVGLQSNSPPEGEKFFCSSLNFNYQRVLKNNRMALGTGVDLFYNDAINSNLNSSEDSVCYGNIYNFRTGVHFSYNLLFNKITYTIQAGVYTFSKWKEFEIVYNRYGVIYQATDRFTLHVALKTHLVKADYLELGVGYVFSKK